MTILKNTLFFFLMFLLSAFVGFSLNIVAISFIQFYLMFN